MNIARTPPAIVALLAALVLSGCEAEIADVDTGVALSRQTEPVVRILTDDAFDRWRLDGYRLMAMEVREDLLVLQISYYGGCIVHDFALLARDRFGVGRVGVFGLIWPPEPESEGGSAAGEFGRPTPAGHFGPLPRGPFGFGHGVPRPKLSLTLSHDARGEVCRELVFEELRFDLTPVRRHFQRTFGSTEGEMILALSAGRVIYDF